MKEKELRLALVSHRRARQRLGRLAVRRACPTADYRYGNFAGKPFGAGPLVRIESGGSHAEYVDGGVALLLRHTGQQRRAEPGIGQTIVMLHALSNGIQGAN